MKKSMTWLLLAAMLLSTFAGCAEDTAESETSGGNSAVNTETESESVFDPADTSVDGKTHYADLYESVNYDGWTLLVGNDRTDAGYTFVAEEMTGETLNDLIYERNERIKTKFNIDIQQSTEGGTTMLRASVTAGSNDVAFSYVLLDGAANYVIEDLLRSISSMPVIDLTNPWWDQGSQETIAFNDILYFGLNDLCYNHYESMATLFYNGQIIEDFNLEDPYELYFEDAWTIDKMGEMMTAVADDLNGNGKVDFDADRFGYTGRRFENLPWLYASGTGLLAYDNAENTYALHVDSEAVMAVGEAISSYLYDNSVMYEDSRDSASFMAGNSLFLSHQLNEFRNLRSADDDYGIICFPGVDGDREKMQVYVQNPFAIMIPSTCLGDEAERLGTVMEAWAADSYDTLMTPYFEYAVIGKGARDENSANMLRIMREIRAYDLCYVFGTKKGIAAWTLGLESNTYASSNAKFKATVNKTVAKAIEALTADPFLEQGIK